MDRITKIRLSRRDRRRSTNSLSGVSQQTIQLYREAFNIIDQDGDGYLSKEDLRGTLTSLGTNVSNEVLNHMISEMPEPINFTSWLMMFVDQTTNMETPEVISGRNKRLNNICEEES